MRKAAWIFGNVYGKIFGWRLLAPLHHAVANLSVHALGYGNVHFNGSGEKWFIKKKLSPTKPNIVFDVGANVGNYSRLLLQETDAKIYAIEPNPNAFEYLEKLDERVTKIQCAVSDGEGNATLHFKSSLDEKASLDPAGGKFLNGLVVKVKTLEQIVKEQSVQEIDFIKIDTEGFEKEVISGLGKLRPKFIQFEFNINHLHRSVSLLDITTLLPEYHFYRLLPNGWLKINPNKYLNNIYMFCNIVAVKSRAEKTQGR